MPYFQSWPLDTLAESSEKIRCIQFGKNDVQIVFLDSLKFMKDSLANLIVSQRKAYEHDLSSGFRNMTMHHPMICKFSDTGVLAELRMLLQKIPFPYRALTGQEFWSKPALLDKDAYYDDLRQKPISEERYEELKTILNHLGIATCRELHSRRLFTYRCPGAGGLFCDLSEDVSQQQWSGSSTLFGPPGRCVAGTLKDDRCSH